METPESYTPTHKQSTEKVFENLNEALVSTEKDTEKASPWTNGQPEAPDGGLTAWLVVLGCWCTGFCSYGWLNSVGIFQEYYAVELLSEYSAGTVAWIPSLQIFFMLGLGPFVGAYFDRHGPHLLIAVGTFLHVLGIMMTSLSTQYYQILLAQGICSAIGASCIFQPSVTCAAGWFNKKRDAVFGVMFTGSSLGGIIFPIMVARLIPQIGFPWTMRVCGLLILGLLIIANLTIKAFVPPKPQPVTFSQLARPFKEVDFLFLALGFLLFSYGYFIPVNYLPSQALAAGMDPNFTAYLVAIFNAASLVGRLVAGATADKTGKYNMLILVSYISGILVLALWLPAHGDASIIAFGILFGAFSGIFITLSTPLVLEISPFSELGFRTGITQLASAVAGLTTNPIAGAILDGTGGWTSVKIFSGIFCIAGTVAVQAVRVRRVGWKMTRVF